MPDAPTATLAIIAAYKLCSPPNLLQTFSPQTSHDVRQTICHIFPSETNKNFSSTRMLKKGLSFVHKWTRKCSAIIKVSQCDDDVLNNEATTTTRLSLTRRSRA
eukprot:SAG11_NODE_3224_length_2600_cov_3.746901_3_plen_104_part_00